MDKKTKAQVRIYGNDYTLIGTESEEYINKVCFTVDKKMREIAENPILKPIKISVLTAVNFCDEYFKANMTIEELKEKLQAANAQMAELKDEIATLTEEKNYLKDEIQTLRKRGY